ncbi:MAG: DUF4136 domain-containing protein [Balneolaceae bacterium]
MSIESDYDREVSFSDLVSYGWIESANPYEDRGALGFDNDIMARRIQNMVHAEMDSLGYLYNESYEEAGSDKPDFEVSYRMLASEEIEHVRSTHPIGYHSSRRGHGGHGRHGRHGRYGGHGGHSGIGMSSYARDIVQCVLMIDVWDYKTDRLVWRGWARWQMNEQPSPEEVTLHLERAVVEILSEFPPNRDQDLSSLR